MPDSSPANLRPLLRPLGAGQYLLLDPEAPAELDADWFDLARWGAAAQPLRDGGRAPVQRLQTPLGPLVWRHYRRGGAVGRWLADRYLWMGLRRSRPWGEASSLLRLRAAGLRVPTLLAARIERDGIWYRADLLTGWIADSRSLAARLTQAAMDEAAWSALGRAIARLHACGCEHADLNAHNILYDGQQQIWLLDFDRARWHEPVPGATRWGQANLARLLRSLHKLRLAPAPALWAALMRGYAEATGATSI